MYGQGAFSVLDSHPENSRNPHPEKGARTTVMNRQGYAGDIAYTNGCGKCGTERLEMVDIAVIVRVVVITGNNAQSMSKSAYLYKPQFDGDEDTVTQQQDDYKREKAWCCPD